MTIEQFFFNVFFAGLSAFMGVLLGVAWSNRQRKRDRKHQLQVLRDNLVKAFRSNLDRIAQCIAYLEKIPPIIPNFRLDTSTVVHILFNGRELYANEGLFERFSWQRYQLEHINAKLDYVHTYLGNASLSQAALASLLQHLRVTQRDITNLLAEYEGPSASPPPSA